MRLCTLLLVVVAAVVSRRCVTHREAGALLRDHQLEGELTDQQIRTIRTGAIYTKLIRRGSGAAEAIDTALMRSNKIILPSTFRRYTQYASTPRQVQADAAAWIEARVAARDWGKLSAKQAYDCYITRHNNAGGDSADLWRCVCDKLLQCAFQDRLQRGPLHGTNEVAVVLFSGSQSTTRPFKQAGYSAVLNAERIKKIDMGPNFPPAKTGRPIDIGLIAKTVGKEGEIIASVVKRWARSSARAWSTTMAQAGIPCR